MNKRYHHLIFISVLLIISIVPILLKAGGLRTTFSSVLIENLKIGKSYSLLKTVNLPLKIKSTYNRNIKIKITVLKPYKDELKKGFEIIPDTLWIKIKNDLLTIKPKGSAFTDVIIKIPYDKKYLGKKFQVMIWSRTTGKGIGCGLKSRLLFTIVPLKKTKKKVKE